MAVVVVVVVVVGYISANDTSRLGYISRACLGNRSTGRQKQQPSSRLHLSLLLSGTNAGPKPTTVSNPLKQQVASGGPAAEVNQTHNWQLRQASNQSCLQTGTLFAPNAIHNPVQAAGHPTTAAAVHRPRLPQNHQKSRKLMRGSKFLSRDRPRPRPRLPRPRPLRPPPPRLTKVRPCLTSLSSLSSSSQLMQPV
jgi:hypothetical protein